MERNTFRMSLNAIRTALFRARRPRELSVYISIRPDGERSVSIHGGTAAEVHQLMETTVRLHPQDSMVTPHALPAPAVPPTRLDDEYEPF